MTSPTQVFKRFERDDLLHIIKYRNIEVLSKLADEPDKNLVKLLAEEVSATGVLLMFESLSKELLLKITTDLSIKYPGYDDDLKPTTRLMAKRLTVAVGEASSAKHWFTHECADHLEAIIDELGEDVEDVDVKDKDKAAKAIIASADEMGVYRCLSAFAADLLIRFAKGSGLEVYGSNREKILQALQERTNMEKPKPAKKKKKKETEEPSESRPKIAKGISKVDLNSWYYAADLAEWCKDRDLPHHATKKVLVKQILDHFDGKEIPKKEKKEKEEGEKKKKKPVKRRTRAPIGQAKRPKRKPKKKVVKDADGNVIEAPKKAAAPRKTPAKQKAEGEAAGAPAAKRAKTTTTEKGGEGSEGEK